LPTAVTRTLPVTVAVTVFSAAFGPYRLVNGCAADQGGTVAPYCALLNAACCAKSTFGAAAAASAIAAMSTVPTPACLSCSSLSSSGSASQVSWSATEYARTLGMLRQLSIEPVGQGGTQAMQKLHLSASTT